MPRKIVPKQTCELCCIAIEKDQDSLQCKGECSCIVHRYCAGVTKCHYEEMNKESTQFVYIIYALYYTKKKTKKTPPCLVSKAEHTRAETNSSSLPSH